MRVLRPFIWAVFLAAGFVYLTSVTRWDVGRIVHPGKLWSAAPASAAGGYSTDEQNNIDIYKSSRDATVSITSVVYHEDFFWGVSEGQGAGSGFIVHPDGQILTNFHVVSGTAQLTVTLPTDKKPYKAKILATDPRSDLALIKIDAPRKLPALRLGDSDSLVVGQKVLAIGNPFGLFGGTLTTGVVSALDRSIKAEDQRQMEGMIQTDAAINPGNSGGPLLDSRGNVIGINTMIFGQQGNIGLGFALPINHAKDMLDEYTKTGHISRPAQLGIYAPYFSGELAEALDLPSSGGLLVQRVQPGSAAGLAGIHGPNRMVIVGNYRVGVGGDLIVAVEGKPVESEETLRSALNHKKGTDTLGLTVYRNGRNQLVKIQLQEARSQQ
jgi:S1-C subfamily serine protease